MKIILNDRRYPNVVGALYNLYLDCHNDAPQNIMLEEKSMWIQVRMILNKMTINEKTPDR